MPPPQQNETVAFDNPFPTPESDFSYSEETDTQPPLSGPEVPED